MTTGNQAGSASPQASALPRVRLPALPLPVLLGGMLIGGLCLLLALNTASAAEELRQRTLTDSNASASDTEQQLIRDLASRQAPAALAAAAASLGLVPNPNPAFLRINADGSVTVLGSPTPASVPPAPVTATPHPATPSSTPAKPSSTPAKSRSGSPVVTVTVTKAVPPASATPRPTGSSRPTATARPTATGGHR
ncbi:MAG TPA: hypothetical protein VFU36_03365 [Jatrophihabitans sp.]|nr:hypothetical protein [Jatrophihabitans sp.]